MTDIAGLRVVTLFREDVISAPSFPWVINHDGAFVAGSPFKKDILSKQ